MPYSCSGDMRRAAGWGPHPPLWTAWCTRGPVDGYGYALDASTGELRWLGDGLQLPPSPAVGDSVVYVGSQGHCVYALYASDR